MTLNNKIIRGYDIRGIYNQEFYDQDAYIIGLAFGHDLSTQNIQTICVGYDSRPSSLQIFHHFCTGLKKFNIKIYNLGLITSPMLYFATKILNVFYGAIITASHNHISYNGIKFNKQNAVAMSGEEIKKIIQNYIALPNINKIEKGELIDCDIKEPYINYMLHQQENNNKLTIAWDGLNGVANIPISSFTQNLPGQHYILHDDLNNLFTNPDPLLDTNLIDIQSLIKKKKCDLGLVFDGDGDRLRVLDELGNPVAMEHLIMIFTQYIYKKTNSTKVIYDVKCSDALFYFLQKLGIEAIISPIGHSSMKKKMAESHANLTGEISGHFIFSSLGFDDAIYAALILISILNQEQKKLTEIIDQLPKFYCSENIKFYLENKKITSILEHALKFAQINNLPYSQIDGIKIIYAPFSWILLRQSKTEDCLNARCEGINQADLIEKKKIIQSFVSATD